MTPNAVFRSDATTGKTRLLWRTNLALETRDEFEINNHLHELISKTPSPYRKALREILEHWEYGLLSQELGTLLGQMQSAGDGEYAAALLHRLEELTALEPGRNELRLEIATLRQRISSEAGFGVKFERSLDAFTKEALHPASLAALWLAPELGLRGRFLIQGLFSKTLQKAPGLLGLWPEGLALAGSLALESGAICLGNEFAAPNRLTAPPSVETLQGNFQSTFLNLMLFKAGTAAVFRGLSGGLAMSPSIPNIPGRELALQTAMLSAFAITRKVRRALSPEEKSENHFAVEYFQFWMLSRLNFSGKRRFPETPSSPSPWQPLRLQYLSLGRASDGGLLQRLEPWQVSVSESRGAGGTTAWRNNIRPFSQEDYHGVHRVLSRAFPGWNSSPEEIRFQDRNRDPKCRMRRWVLEYEGNMVGMAEYSQLPQMYHPRKFLVNIAVDPMFHGRGMGTALLSHVTDGLRPFKPISLRAEIQESAVGGRRFLEKHGFREDMRVIELDLDLRQVSPEALQRWKTGVQAADIQIHSLEHLDRLPGIEKKIHALMVRLMKDQPQPEPHTPLSFQSFLNTVYNNPQRPHGGFFVAVSGEKLIGLSHVLIKNEGLVMNRLTGVLPEYRKIGLATALKAHGIEYAKSHGYQKIRTVNVSTNQAILRANLGMGYIPERAWASLVKDLSEIKPE